MDNISKVMSQISLDTINESSEDYKAYFVSPSYSPLESPVRNTNDYLEIFGECVICVSNILDSIENNYKSQTTIKRELSQQIIQETTKKIKIDSEKNFKFIYFHTNYAEDYELSIFFKLSNVKYSKFSPYKKFSLQKTIISHKSNEFMEYLIHLIKDYVKNLSLNFYSDKFDSVLAKYYLNQYMEMLKDSNNNPESQLEMKFRQIFAINYCYSCLDYLSNCSYLTTLCFMDSIKDEFKLLLGNEYDKLMYIYQKIKLVSSQDYYKIQIVCDILKEAKLLELKVMIVFDRDLGVLLNEIKNMIEYTVDIKCTLLKSGNMFFNKESLCFLIHRKNLIRNHFELFQLFIEYESNCVKTSCSNEQINFKDIKKKHSIEYLSFEKYSFSVNKPSLLEQMAKLENKILIVSHEIITRETNLLDILENKLDFTIVVRDYHEIHKKYKLKSVCLSADILINELVGVLIYDSNETSNITDIQTRLEYLKFQLEFCYILFYPFKNRSVYQNEKDIKENLIQIIDLINKKKTIKVKMIQLNNIDEMLDTLGTIYIKNYRNISYKINIEDCINEIFLLAFGCFNSFSSQYLLNLLTIEQLMNINLDKLIEKCSGSISPRFLEIFVKFLSQPIRDICIK